MKYQCSKERFLEDIKTHELTILKDEGLYRHITMKKPGSNNLAYSITTWPGYLCISGDMGCWVFSRIADMFEFFMMDDNDFNKKNVINPRYWEEKVLSISRFGGPVSEFDEGGFAELIRQIITEYYENDPEKTTECLEQAEDEILSHIEDEHHQLIYERTYLFKYEDFSFDEVPTCNKYTFHYIWILYAIVYGITEYNKNKEGE